MDEVAQDEADLLLVAPYWPQRPWFPRLLRLLVGLPVASSTGPSGTTPFSGASSQGRKSSSFSMASLRQQGEVAGLSLRAAQFSALSQFTRNTYVSRLDAFDPTTASLGVVADFLDHSVFLLIDRANFPFENEYKHQY